MDQCFRIQGMCKRPNPTSGFIIVVPKRDVIELDMEVDEAVKLIMSLGVVVPTWRREEIPELPLKMPEEDGHRDSETPLA